MPKSGYRYKPADCSRPNKLSIAFQMRAACQAQAFRMAASTTVASDWLLLRVCSWLNKISGSLPNEALPAGSTLQMVAASASSRRTT